MDRGRVDAKTRTDHRNRLEEHKAAARTNLLVAAQRNQQARQALLLLEDCEKQWSNQPGGITQAQKQWLEWASQEAYKTSPFAYGYPNLEKDGPINYEAIPLGGPYPEVTPLPSTQHQPTQNTKLSMDYGKDDAPYPFWLKYQK